jgi:Flp pilus assembly protein TadG
MRSPRARRATPRRGAAVVETSVVLCIFLLFVFGLLEYAKFVFVYQSMQNAAREGARYAIAVINPDTVTDANVEAEVLRRLKGVDRNPKKFTVTTYGITLRTAPGTQLAHRYDASCNDGVVVEVSYNYTPALPSFLMMKKSIPIKARCVMYAEGN